MIGCCFCLVLVLLSVYTIDISELDLEEWNPINVSPDHSSDEIWVGVGVTAADKDQ